MLCEFSVASMDVIGHLDNLSYRLTLSISDKLNDFSSVNCFSEMSSLCFWATLSSTRRIIPWNCVYVDVWWSTSYNNGDINWKRIIKVNFPNKIFIHFGMEREYQRFMIGWDDKTYPLINVGNAYIDKSLRLNVL